MLQLENEVHQAMEVMDVETGKLLNYKQLLQNPKYKKRYGSGCLFSWFNIYMFFFKKNVALTGSSFAFSS